MGLVVEVANPFFAVVHQVETSANRPFESKAVVVRDERHHDRDTGLVGGHGSIKISLYILISSQRE